MKYKLTYKLIRFAFNHEKQKIINGTLQRKKNII